MCRGWDLNPRPIAYETIALPTKLPRQSRYYTIYNRLLQAKAPFGTFTLSCCGAHKLLTAHRDQRSLVYLVAEPRVALGPSGYEPDEVLFLYPAMFVKAHMSPYCS